MNQPRFSTKNMGILFVVGFLGCGDGGNEDQGAVSAADESETVDTADGTVATESVSDGSTTSASGGSTTSASASGASTTSESAGSVSTSESASSNPSTSGDPSTTGDPGDGPSPDPQFLPQPTGPCPDFVEGILLFAPDGRAREAQIWIGPEAETLDGPLVFFWHGMTRSPMDAIGTLGGMGSIDDIKSLGGIVAGPVADPESLANNNYPWFYTGGTTNWSTSMEQPDYDIRLADEILACAIETVGVDTRRIHSLGFSAGANNTMHFSWRRSGYLASVVTYSGARTGDDPLQDPENLFAAAIFHGGETDTFTTGDGSFTISFQDGGNAYYTELTQASHFAFICDHGLGHKSPGQSGGPGLEVAASGWQFLRDHPFGITPDPYANGLPADFPSYCQL